MVAVASSDLSFRKGQVSTQNKHLDSIHRLDAYYILIDYICMCMCVYIYIVIQHLTFRT